MVQGIHFSLIERLIDENDCISFRANGPEGYRGTYTTQEVRKMRMHWFGALALCLMAAFVPSKAGAEVAVGIFFSVGSSKDAIEGTLVLQDSRGRVLTPNDGVVEIPGDEPIYGQVLIPGLKDPDKFKVGWTTGALAHKAVLSNAEFDSRLGWLFEIGPSQTAQPREYGMPLQLVVTDRKGKRSYIDFVIGSIGRRSSVTKSSVLLLKVTSSTGYDQNGGVTNSSGNLDAVISALRANQHTTADYVNRLEERVTNLENWASLASNARTGSVSTVLVTFKFPRVASTTRIKIVCLDSKKVYPPNRVTASEFKVWLIPGNYQVAVSNGDDFDEGIPLVIDNSHRSFTVRY